LRRHGRVSIDLVDVVHVSLRLAIRSRCPGLSLNRVHALRLPVVVLGRNGVAAQSIVGCCHGMLAGVVSGHLGLVLSCSRLRCLLGGSLSGVRALSMSGSLLPWYNIDEEVKHVGLGQGRCNVGALESSSLVLFGVDPGAHGELGDEDVAALGEEDGRLGRDHLNFGVRLHDLLYPGQGQLVELVVMGVALEVVNRVLPVGSENFLEMAMESLVDICPGTGIELGWRKALLGQLETSVSGLLRWLR